MPIFIINIPAIFKLIIEIINFFVLNYNDLKKIKVLREGTEKANKAANETLLEIKKAMGIDYFDNDNFEKEQIAKYAK